MAKYIPSDCICGHADIQHDSVNGCRVIGCYCNAFAAEADTEIPDASYAPVHHYPQDQPSNPKDNKHGKRK